MKLHHTLSFVLIATALLTGCKQDLPRKLEVESVFGTVTEKRMVDNVKHLIYVSGADPYQKNWGTAASYEVTVNGQVYRLHWDQAEKFKELATGDKVNLHPSEYIDCVGEADLKPDCTRLMRVYKSERRIQPLQTN